eukprot:8477315-Pyramimonas_sp.AAC.1
MKGALPRRSGVALSLETCSQFTQALELTAIYSSAALTLKRPGVGLALWTPSQLTFRNRDLAACRGLAAAH